MLNRSNVKCKKKIGLLGLVISLFKIILIFNVFSQLNKIILYIFGKDYLHIVFVYYKIVVP